MWLLVIVKSGFVVGVLRFCVLYFRLGALCLVFGVLWFGVLVLGTFGVWHCWRLVFEVYCLLCVV